jgi:hypothetical protein
VESENTMKNARSIREIDLRPCRSVSRPTKAPAMAPTSAAAPIDPSVSGDTPRSMTMIGMATAMMNRSKPSRKTPIADSHQIFQCIGVRTLASSARSSAR